MDGGEWLRETSSDVGGHAMRVSGKFASVLHTKPSSHVDYPDCPGVVMYFDARSVIAPNKLQCLVTGATATLERNLFSVDANDNLVIADDEWKTIKFDGDMAATGRDDFAIVCAGTMNILGAAGGYFKVGDSVDAVSQSSKYGPGISLRSGGGGVIYDEYNYITGSPTLTIGTPFTGSMGLVLKKKPSSIYKTFRGTTNASASEAIADDPATNAGSFDRDWPAFSKFITYGSGLEAGYGPVKNWAHGFALPRSSTLKFACVVKFSGGAPDDILFDHDLDYINTFGFLPPWWL